MTVPIDAVEAAARAAQGLLTEGGPIWEDLSESSRDHYRDEARTALMSVHAGWRRCNSGDTDAEATRG